MNVSEKCHPDELEAVLKKHETSEYENLFLQHDSLKSLVRFHRENVYDSVAEFEKIKSREKKYQFKSDNRDIYHISPQIRSLINEKILSGWYDSRFHSELDSFGTRNCITWGFGDICKGGCGETVVIPYLCKDRFHCPVCSKKYSMKRALKILEVFSLVPDSYLIHLTLTYPQNYFSGDLSKEEIERKIHIDSREFVKRCYDKRVGGVKRVHSWHTHEPLRSPHWHVHILIPSFVFYPVTIDNSEIVGNSEKSKKITVDYAIKHLRVLKTKEELDEMRKVWADIIGYDKPVNFHYQYSNKISKIAHWCNYDFRSSVPDINVFLKKKGSDYKLTQEEKEWFWYHTDYEPEFRAIRWFGFLCDSQRGKSLSFVFPTDWKILLEKNISSIWICPKCAEPIDRYDLGVHTMPITSSKLIAIRCGEESWERYKNDLKTCGVG